jgi:hypothetical protein
MCCLGKAPLPPAGSGKKDWLECYTKGLIRPSGASELLREGLESGLVAGDALRVLRNSTSLRSGLEQCSSAPRIPRHQTCRGADSNLFDNTRRD